MSALAFRELAVSCSDCCGDIHVGSSFVLRLEHSAVLSIHRREKSVTGHSFLEFHLYRSLQH